jgi:hypothetical protein
MRLIGQMLSASSLSDLKNRSEVGQAGKAAQRLLAKFGWARADFAGFAGQ